MELVEVLFGLLIIHGLITAVGVVLERRAPAASLVWIGTLILLPGVGAVLYWLFGRRKFKRVARWRDRAHARVSLQLPQQPPEVEPNRQKRKLMRLVQAVTGNVESHGNIVSLLSNANRAYPEMLQAIECAQHHVHMEMYIFRSDETGVAFAQALLAAQKRGVTVRVLLDAVGNMGTELALFRPLRAAGGEVAFFAPFKLRPLTQRLNFRNHRKVLVVDGHTAFVGGLNIGDEYRGLDPSLGNWRDTNLMLKGNAVNHVQQVFLEDWCYATDEAVEGADYFNRNADVGGATVQILPSGPDLEWGAIHQAFFRAIAGADERVYITSPYFIPDETMVDALTTTALAGVDVRLVVPSRSDLPLVAAAGRTYFPELLKAGVRIFEYQAGFIHAKTILVDDWAALVGSANMDIRSFQLNFEINAIVYDAQFVAAADGFFALDLAHSNEVTLAQWRERPLPRRFFDGLARLLSPLL